MSNFNDHDHEIKQIEINEGVSLPKEINLKYINDYKSPDLILKFKKEHEYTEKAALILFKELKKYLTICAANRKPYPPSKSIDHIWHTFILFTSDYSKFCNQAFGRYIHHAPNIGDTGSRINIEPFQSTVKALKETFNYYNEHFWEHLAPGDGDEDDDNGCTHNDCGPVDSDVHDPQQA